MRECKGGTQVEGGDGQSSIPTSPHGCFPHQALGTEWHSLEGPVEISQCAFASLKAISLMGEDKSTGNRKGLGHV